MAWVEGFGGTSGTGTPDRFGTGRFKPSGAGGCRLNAILPSGIHGGREERKKGEWPAVIWSKGVCTGKPELGTSLPLGEIRGD